MAGTRGQAELYAGGRIGGFPVNLYGSLTVETIDPEASTFSASFTLQPVQTGAEVTVRGTITNLPLIAIADCRTSGDNRDGLFTFRVEGSTAIESFELPANAGAWSAQTRRTFVEGGSPYIDLTLQDTLEGEGLRLEIARIRLDEPEGVYSADPEDERSVAVSLTNRAGFQLDLIDEGTLDLTFDTEAGTLSGGFKMTVRSRGRTTEARITGSFRDLPIPTRLCELSNT